MSASIPITFIRTDLFPLFVHSFSSPPGLVVGGKKKKKNHTYILFIPSGTFIKYTLASVAGLVSNREKWWMVLPSAYCPFSPSYVRPLNKMKRFAVRANKHRATIYLISPYLTGIWGKKMKKKKTISGIISNAQH